MRSILPLVLIVGCCGCVDSAELAALKASLRTAEETIVAKQDESIEILRENTNALAAIKSQVEALQASTQDTRSKLETLEAKLVSPKASSPKEVITSADEAAAGKIANDSHPSNIVVAAPSAARPFVSAAPKLRWNIEGDWTPTAAETAAHLREDHGVNVAGMTEQQMHDLHADLHEGRQAVATKAQPVRLVNRGSSCPGGVCPTSSRTVRRGLFGWRRR